MLLEIHIDGACKGNPGPGGWGVVLDWNGTVKEICGGKKVTTNNQMELQAAIEAMKVVKKKIPIKIITDSGYVHKGVTEWLNNWRKNGWKTKANKPIANRTQWEELSNLIEGHDIEWVWVKGHSGNAGNEHADRLANLGAENYGL
jgi:ribonuclease HI